MMNIVEINIIMEQRKEYKMICITMSFLQKEDLYVVLGAKIKGIMLQKIIMVLRKPRFIQKKLALAYQVV